jgi:hypothetical protein
MDEGYAATQMGEGCLSLGGGDSLMTTSAGSVSTQSIAFKYGMASKTRIAMKLICF